MVNFHIKSDRQLVVGDTLTRPLADFVRDCCLYIEIEKRQPTPDNGLIGLLSDAVRLARQGKP